MDLPIRLIAASAAAALIVALVPTMTVAGEEPDARIADDLAAWVDQADAGDRATVIVTFPDRGSVERITTLDPAATLLSRLPMAIATLTAAQIGEAASWRCAACGTTSRRSCTSRTACRSSAPIASGQGTDCTSRTPARASASG